MFLAKELVYKRFLLILKSWRNFEFHEFDLLIATNVPKRIPYYKSNIVYIHQEAELFSNLIHITYRTDLLRQGIFYQLEVILYDVKSRFIQRKKKSMAIR